MARARNSWFCSLLAVLVLPAAGLAQDPAIINQPLSLQCTVGARAVFSVLGQGTPPVTYLWTKDGARLPAATNSVLVLTNVQFANAGAYQVAVSNGLGGLVSQKAQLTVKLPSAGDLDRSFLIGSSMDSQVNAFALQPDGKILV